MAKLACLFVYNKLIKATIKLSLKNLKIMIYFFLLMATN